MIFLHLHAMTVVVNMSSAMPPAIFPITFADAGAINTTSACFASATCSTLYWKLRSNVSTRHLVLVNVSNVIGLIKLVAFFVINTCTCACIFTSILARFAILYAAILPVTPSTTVFPLSIFLSSMRYLSTTSFQTNSLLHLTAPGQANSLSRLTAPGQANSLFRLTAPGQALRASHNATLDESYFLHPQRPPLADAFWLLPGSLMHNT